MPGSTLSLKEMAAVLQAAGFSKDQSATGAAIGMAESGGNIYAVGDTDTAYPSIGFMQIRLLPERKAAGATKAKLWDPVYNAQWAYRLYNSGGWNHWSVYKSGAYKEHLNDATSAANDLASSSGGSLGGIWNVVEGILEAIPDPTQVDPIPGFDIPILGDDVDVPGFVGGKIGEVFSFFLGPLKEGFKRGALIVGGAILLLVMLFMLLFGGGMVRDTTRAIAKVKTA